MAAALVTEYGIPTFAIKGEDRDTYYSHLVSVLERKPHMTMDDGADLVSVLHKERADLLEGILAGTEETTTGVIRLRSMAKDSLGSKSTLHIIKRNGYKKSAKKKMLRKRKNRWRICIRG